MYISGIIFKNEENQLWLECLQKHNNNIIKQFDDPNKLAEKFILGSLVILKINNKIVEEVYDINDVVKI